MLNCYLVHFVAGFFVVSGLVSFCWSHKHLLVTLLSLEYIMLILFVLLVFSGSWGAAEIYMSLIFLIFTVAEGALGLSVLVVISRSHGSDYLSSFSMMW